MINLPVSVKIFLAIEPCDMRKSFSGLQAIARDRLKEDPCSGALFLFTNKNKNRLKILYWDGTGIWVLCKRLERGRFSWPCGVNESDGKLNLDRRAMALFLEGVDLKKGAKKAWYEQ